MNTPICATGASFLQKDKEKLFWEQRECKDSVIVNSAQYYIFTMGGGDKLGGKQQG